MTITLLLFILRLLSALLLLTFLIVLVWFIYRDMRTTAAALSARQKPQGHLRVVESESAQLSSGMQFPLLPVTGIGRSPSNTIVIDDDYASGEHVLITLRGQRWWVEDLNSRNGTLLNDQLLGEAAVVSTGDILTIGSTKLKLEL